MSVPPFLVSDRDEPVTTTGLLQAMASWRSGLIQAMCGCRLFADVHATLTFLDVLFVGAHATLTVTMNLTWVLLGAQLPARGCGAAMLTFLDTMLAFV